MTLATITANNPNRHPGVSSKDCNCGLVHDDELKTLKQYRQQVIDALGGRCSNSKCRWLNEDGTLGCHEQVYLQVDHVHDDGYLDKSRRSNSYWPKVLREVQSGTGRYQLLCANCNWAKRQTSMFSRANCGGPSILNVGKGGLHSNR